MMKEHLFHFWINYYFNMTSNLLFSFHLKSILSVSVYLIEVVVLCGEVSNFIPSVPLCGQE